MAKMKTGVGSTGRENDEIREIEVKLDFTPNALSSLLYSQGDTIRISLLLLVWRKSARVAQVLRVG